jgi:hypothetical protein
MKPVLTSLILVFAAHAQAQVPPLPPGLVVPVTSPRSEPATRMVATVAPAPTNGLFRIRVVRYTAQISRVEFYCVTNRQARWKLERSADLRAWTLVEQNRATNDWAPTVPLLAGDARLVTWQLVSPGQRSEFYRITPLP